MISDDDLKVAIINHGEVRTQKMLEVLVNRQPYYSVIKSELGQLLLKKHIDELKEVYDKIFEGDKDPELFLYVKALERVLDFWLKIISTQNELTKKIKGEL